MKKPRLYQTGALNYLGPTGLPDQCNCSFFGYWPVVFCHSFDHPDIDTRWLISAAEFSIPAIMQFGGRENQLAPAVEYSEVFITLNTNRERSEFIILAITVWCKAGSNIDIRAFIHSYCHIPFTFTACNG